MVEGNSRHHYLNTLKSCLKKGAKEGSIDLSILSAA